MSDPIGRIETRISEIERRLDQVFESENADGAAFAQHLANAESGRTLPPVPRVLLEGLAERKAAENGLDPALLKAVIEAESGWDVNARSNAGALGLMQLMPGTAAALGVVGDVFDPERNVGAGARYLSQKLSEFGDVEVALAAYNAGSGAVRRYGNTVPPFSETQEYVKRVMELYRRNSTLR